MVTLPTDARSRGAIISLVGECLDKPGAERPVTIMLGPPGSGSSEMHASLVEKYGEEHPFAYLNLGRQKSLLPRHVLGALAFRLESHNPAYSRVTLPRLRLGLLASDNDYSELSRKQSESAIKQSLKQFERKAEERYDGNYLAAFAKVADHSLGAPEGASELVVELLKRLSRSTRSYLRGFSGPVRWYGEHRLTQDSNGWRALAELSNWRHSGDTEEQRKLDQMLFSAFLADLRERADSPFRPHSFLLLLEDADTAGGRHFLDLLIRTRHEDALRGGGRADPLTVVVSAHRWLPRWGPSTGDQWPWRRPLEPDYVSLDDWGERRRPWLESEDSWWYPVRLRDLSPDEVRVRMELAAPSSPALARCLHLAPFVHRLTGGMPRAVQDVLTVITQQGMPGNDGPEQDVWLRALPDRTLRATEHPDDRTGDGASVPDAETGPRLVDSALRQLLRGFAPDDVDLLVRCAAARDLSSAIRLHSKFARLFNELRARWLLAPWTGDGGEAPDEAPSLHPWLRRLLLWRLAERADDWTTVHEELAEHFRETGNPTHEMYHRLAAGQLEKVTGHLAGRFGEQHATAWVASFNVITTAPNRFAPGDGPRTLFAGLLAAVPADSEVTVTALVRGLVAARWVWCDPLADPRRRLKETLADGFGQLTRLSGRDVVVLLDEAERYRYWRTSPATSP
ncbi:MULTISPECIES: hypothetical protein [Actinoalloteichus]|uniref:Uncharacterized protein n=1 Tax=Actinoalloteichus fjordicus TaxID=1612552 RepID=A0AAC9LCZ4_9PSEU|nr:MULTISPECIES: hypothetical protein [Actinoalloteichus]APU15346.1 hypothetical protein UA74_16580 [Actinoalloteichus fjordicus]APU21413.1 hypothetical protein UA75_17115 [Actinoalloteichus sp. GBA129-24]